MGKHAKWLPRMWNNIVEIKQIVMEDSRNSIRMHQNSIFLERKIELGPNKKFLRTSKTLKKMDLFLDTLITIKYSGVPPLRLQWHLGHFLAIFSKYF